MELALLLYAASIAENLRGGFGFFITALFLLGLVSCIVVAVSSVNLTETARNSDKFENLHRANRIGRKLFVACFFGWTALMLLSSLVPSRKDVYVMAGGYVALKAVNSEVVQTTANSVLGSIEHWLDKELSKASPETTKKKERK